MAKMEERNEALRAVTREKILSAATVLFARKGLAGTGVQEIADMADLSVGMLYRHFKTKDDIFGALLEKAIVDMKAFSKIIEGGNIPPVDLIKISARTLIEKISNDDEYLHFQKLLSRAADDIPYSLPHMTGPMLEYVHDFQGKLANVIEQGQNDGTFRQGCANGMANLFLAAIQGLCAWKLANKDRYVSPAPQMLTAFLLKEEFNIYD